MIRLVIADDHRIIREGIAMIIDQADDIEIVGEASDGPELLDLLEETPADVLLLDVRMPTMTGLTVLEEMRTRGIDIETIMLSMYGDAVYVSRAIELGAQGYLLKNVGREELPRAIRAVHGGQPYLQPEVSSALFARVVDPKAGSVELSTEQAEILQMLADGADNAAIAAALSMAEGTVKSKLRAIYDALGVRRRSEAVAVAMRLGIIN